MQTGAGAPLPTSSPGLVLLGSDDPVLVDRALGPDLGVAVVERRPGATWIEVTDARHVLDCLVGRIATASSGRLRVAFAPSGATLDQVVAAAMSARSLSGWADAIDDASLTAQPLDYRIHYQPIVRLDDGEVIGHEALLRARAGDQIIPADELIERAGRGGWLPELDLLSRQLAIQGLGPWLGDDLLFLNLLAPDGTIQVDAVEATIDAAGQRGVEPDQLVFESNERNRYTDLDATADDVARLRSRGIRIAVDDAGDGFSGVSTIVHLRPDVLKLSGALTRTVGAPETDAAIRALVRLASGSGVWVVAENVETEAQAEAMTALGVDWGQGRWFGPPVSRVPGVLTTG